MRDPRSYTRAQWAAAIVRFLTLLALFAFAMWLLGCVATVERGEIEPGGEARRWPDGSLTIYPPRASSPAPLADPFAGVPADWLPAQPLSEAHHADR